ncbi:MAG: methyl-accepting chemotaxis protein [bacterium]
MNVKTLKSRLNLLIVGIVLCFSLFAYSGISALQKIDESYFDIIEVTQMLLANGSELTDYYGELRRNVARVIYSEDTNQQLIDQTEVYCATSQVISAEYLENLKYVNEQGYDMLDLITSVENIKALQLDYHYEFQDLVSAIKTGNRILIDQANDDVSAVGSILHGEISSVSLATFEALTTEVDQIKSEKNNTTLLLIAMFIISVGFVTLILTLTSRSIRNPVDRLKDASLQVAEGNMNVQVGLNQEDEIGDLSHAVDTMVVNFKSILSDINNLSNNLKAGNTSNYKINEQKYTGAYREVVMAVNQTVVDLLDDNLYVVSMLESFGQGEFENEIKQLPGEKIATTQAVSSVQDILKAFVESITNLTHDVGNGEFKNLLDASSYRGEWVGITNGLNTLVQIIDEAMIDTKASLTAFSEGNFDYRITKDYKGTFSEVVDATNYTAETVGAYISEISEILNEMANQNFNVDMTLNYIGDFKLIQESVENIVTNLNILTKNIITSAEQVSDGATQISSTSIALAQGASEQAGSVESLNSITEIISKQAEESVAKSIQANKLVSETKESANIGNQQMNEMLLAMQEINQSSNSISNIIKVIDDIAFQTNILALNAAVEAARAGEHGKGFAVVAEEVRSLAGRSQQAAKETTELIENSVTKVGEGSIIANNTSEALISIVKQIENISTIIHENQLSSVEQQQLIEDITKNINEISKVTQINTSTSEESSSAAEELSTQASIFYNSVSGIKLKK